MRSGASSGSIDSGKQLLCERERREWKRDLGAEGKLKLVGNQQIYSRTGHGNEEGRLARTGDCKMLAHHTFQQDKDTALRYYSSGQ